METAEDKSLAYINANAFVGGDSFISAASRLMMSWIAADVGSDGCSGLCQAQETSPGVHLPLFDIDAWPSSMCREELIVS
jgi:hypothetical protein